MLLCAAGTAAVASILLIAFYRNDRRSQAGRGSAATRDAVSAKGAPIAPLLGLAMAGDLDGVRKAVEVARAAGRDARTLADEADGEGNSAVHCASFGGHLGVLSFLAEACGADLARKNGVGCSSVWIAAGYGRADVLQYLIDRLGLHGEIQGADGDRLSMSSLSDALFAANGTGDTPLLAAVSKGEVECCRILLKAADATRGGGAIEMLRRANKNGDTPMHVAVGSGGGDGGSEAVMEILELLIDRAGGGKKGEEGVEIRGEESPMNSKNSQGLTPLLIACERNRGDVARALVDRWGALPLPDKNGQSPFAVAAFCGCEDVVRELLKTEAGRAMLNVQDDGVGRFTPLWLAARTGNVSMIRLLRDAGASEDILNSDGLTPLQAAEKYGKEKAVDEFRKGGALVTPKSQ